MTYRASVTARLFLSISSAIFVAVGLGYLVAPGAMLSIVGIGSAATTDFLMRTEGVALLTAAALIWATRDGPRPVVRLALGSIAGYYVVGSIVDLAAWSEGIVGPAAVPSAVVRIAFGVAAAILAIRT